jgi:Gpi18-like mannosyltransferase
MKFEGIVTYVFVSVLLFSTLLFLMPQSSYHLDMMLWQKWTVHTFENGLGNAYGSGTDYLPLYHYVLYLFGTVQGSTSAIALNIHWLKAITLVFHFITAWFVLRIIHKKGESIHRSILYALFYLLNIAILYNSIIWGQVDVILTCFIFISCYFAYRKLILWSLVFFVLALNFKLQAIIFLPLIFLLVVPAIVEKFKWTRLFLWVVIPLGLQFLIVLPFTLEGNLNAIWNVVTGSVDHFPVVSMNAFNFWDLLLEGDLMRMPDASQFLGVSYKMWGLCMFFTSSFFALFPVFRKGIRAVIHKTQFKVGKEQLMLTAALIPLLFFFFNTQMHERYSHPAMVFLVVYAILSENWFIAILGCAAYILNLEAVMHFLQLQDYSGFWIDRHFIATLFLGLIIWLFVLLYRDSFRKRTVIALPPQHPEAS